MPQLLEDVRRLKYDPLEAGEEENEEEVLAKSLTVMGYLVDKVSPCHTATASKTGTGESQRRRSGSWHPSAYSHGFLTVKVTAQEGGRKYLVEPRFRDHFVIQVRVYAALWGCCASETCEDEKDENGRRTVSLGTMKT